MKTKATKKTTEPGFNRQKVQTVEEIGSVLRKVRKENKLTLKQAALLCGVNSRFLSELETGKQKDFKLKVVLKVLNTFGIVLELQKRKL